MEEFILLTWAVQSRSTVIRHPRCLMGLPEGDDFKWFVGPRPYNRLGEGGAVSMAAGYFGFGLTDDETMFLEKRVDGAIHIIELFHALGENTGIITVPTGGDAFREPFGFTDAVPFVVFTEGTV